MAAVMMAYAARDNLQAYPQQYAVYQTRAHHPQPGAVQSLNVNPYADYPAVQDRQECQTAQSRTNPIAQTPIIEDGLRPSLPSISNLLGIADRPTQDGALQQVQPQAQAQLSIPQAPMTSQHISTEHTSNPIQELWSSQRTAIPPTPPLRTTSFLDGTNSPSTISTDSSLSSTQPFLIGSALNNVEAADQRSIAAHQFMKRHSVPSQPGIMSYGSYNASPYAHSPGATSTGSYYSPPDQAPMTSGLYHQRPLPSNFPPQPSLSWQVAHPSSPPRVWEHHHYINPSSQAQFPQSQDRYICPTCDKAFSRPSSLKIHSHSHTGEKPFKCPHAGCGKAFSVRSNMKRHERGCHTPGGGMGVVPSSQSRLE